MTTRHAACSCGQLRVEADGDPVRISVCHCLACQRRTGSAFAAQARFPAEHVRTTGRFTEYVRRSDDGHAERLFRFCPECGGTVHYTTSDGPGTIAIPVGAFADPTFPPPTVSVYESRRHPWVGLAAGVEPEAWEAVVPLYEAGDYADAADRGQELIAAHPEDADLLYNVACCESLAGRTGDALEHLRRAVDAAPGLRELAADDPDFDPIRDEPAFAALVR